MTARRKYPFDALMKAREWELDEFRLKLAAARAALDESESAAQRLAAEIASVESDLSREGAQRQLIQIEKRKLTMLFLRDRHGQLRGQREHVAGKRTEYTDALEAVAAARRSLRVLERHKERLRIAGEQQLATAVQKSMDDLWLSRRQRAGNE